MMDFSELQLLVIGDIILDKFISTVNNRMSPEYPVPVYDIISSDSYPGGAANVAANILALGAQVKLISVIGKDSAADELLNLLKEKNCSTDHILISPKRKTTVKSRLFCDKTPVSRIDDEIKTDIDDDLQASILEQTKLILDTNKVDGIILQDYNKGVLTETLIKNLMAIAIQQKLPVFVDPKLDNYQAYAGATVFKPNLNEIARFLGQKPSIDLKSLGEADKKLRTYVLYDNLVLTLSEKGAYFSTQEIADIVPTHEISDADVCGAGDSFIAALSLSLCHKIPLKQAISFANRVSAVVCSKHGVRTCKMSEL